MTGLLYFASPMRRLDGAARIAVLCAVAIGAAPAVQKAQEPLRPRGRYNNSVHRFFPDLDSRLNAVRYGFLGTSDVSVALSLAVTAVLAGAVVAWSAWLFRTGHRLKP